MPSVIWRRVARLAPAWTRGISPSGVTAQMLHYYSYYTVGQVIPSYCRTRYASLRVCYSRRHQSDWLGQVGKATSCDDVLELVSSSEEWTPTRVTVALRALSRLLEGQLSAFPWAIRGNPLLLANQSFINAEARELYRTIRHCPDFDVLYREAGSQLHSLDDAQLSQVTLCLIKMHVKPHDAVMHSLLVECMNRHERFDLASLVDYCEIGNLMRRPGFVLTAQAVCLLDARWNGLAATINNLVLVSRLLQSSGYFFPRATLCGYQRNLIALLCQWRHEVPAEIVVDILETLQRFSGPVASSLLITATEILLRRVDELSVWHLSRAAFLANVIPRSPVLTIGVRERAAQLLESGECWRPADVVAINYVFHRVGYPARCRDRLERLLEDSIEHFDVMLLKYFSQVTLEGANRSRVLLERFCRSVEARLSDLLPAVSCLLCVTACLSKMIHRSRSLDRLLSRQLMAQVLDQQLGTEPRHLATIARYLLQCWEEQEPRRMALLVELLHRTLPSFAVAEVGNIGLGLPAYPMHRNGRPHVEDTAVILARDVLRRRHEIRHIGVLNLLVRSVFFKVKGEHRDSILHGVCEMYREHGATLDHRASRHTAYILSEMRLFVPEMLDRLAALCTNGNSVTIDIPTLAQIVETLARFNYRPADMDTLREVVVDRLLSLSNDEWRRLAGDALAACAALVGLQACPERLLDRVCCLEFLGHLHDDTRLTAPPGMVTRKMRRVARFLTEINRGTILCNPQVSMPWFCEEYSISINNAQRTGSYVEKMWKEVICDGLTNALGGPKFFKVGPLLAPYNISYDFECVFNENKVPIAINRVSKENEYRFAIILTIPSDFSINGRRHLLGNVENKILQLEILGFLVIQVPFYELESLSSADWESRSSYFKSLFKPKLRLSTSEVGLYTSQ